MLKIKRLVFWEPSISPHKEGFFSALSSENPDLDLVCCADSDISDDRRAMGWNVPAVNGYRNLIAPSKQIIDALVADSLATTLHIFSGIRWFPTIVRGLSAVKAERGLYAIMSEPRVAEGWSGKLRLLQSWLTESYHRRHVTFVLAIGRNGPPWFKLAGYPADCIFPFAYFVSPPVQSIFTPLATGRIRVGYLGRFVKMKGIFDLVRAVALLGSDASLELAGSGPEEGSLQAECASLGVDATMNGVLPISEIGSFFSRIDVLVIASTSTDDGWGVVVSEALMCGVTVVATPMVGASLVLERSLFGRCVPPGSPVAIAEAIRDLKKSCDFATARRKNRASAAVEILSAQAGAKYLMRVLEWHEGLIERPQYFYR